MNNLNLDETIPLHVKSAAKLKRLSLDISIEILAKVSNLSERQIRKHERVMDGQFNLYVKQLYDEGLKKISEERNNNYYNKKFPTNISEYEEKRQTLLDLIEERMDYLNSASYEEVNKAAKKWSLEID